MTININTTSSISNTSTFSTISKNYITIPNTFYNIASTSTTTSIIHNPIIDINYILNELGIDLNNKKINAKNEWSIQTEDGTIININSIGNVEVIDSNARIIYKANNIREFNKYLNCSDLLEEFIRFSGELGVKQKEVLKIPIELFINWIILRAAEEDGEDTTDIPKLEYQKRSYYRCMQCGKFMKKSIYEIAKFCNPEHFNMYLLK